MGGTASCVTPYTATTCLCSIVINSQPILLYIREPIAWLVAILSQESRLWKLIRSRRMSFAIAESALDSPRDILWRIGKRCYRDVCRSYRCSGRIVIWIFFGEEGRAVPRPSDTCRLT